MKPTHGVPLAEEVAHCHRLLDEATVPSEIPAGREAGLIERVSFLVAEVNRLHVKVLLARWEAEAAIHGHRPTYYNDSECRGCAALRGADSELADAAHRYANLTPARKRAEFSVTP